MASRLKLVSPLIFERDCGALRGIGIVLKGNILGGNLDEVTMTLATSGIVTSAIYPSDSITCEIVECDPIGLVKGDVIFQSEVIDVSKSEYLNDVSRYRLIIDDISCSKVLVAYFQPFEEKYIIGYSSHLVNSCLKWFKLVEHEETI